MIQEHFVILGALLNLAGSSSYAWDTLKGTTQPNRVTWFLWMLIPFIAFSAQLSQGVGLRALMTFMVGFGPLLVLIASLANRKAYWKLTRLDYACGALALLAVVLWKITGTGNTAIWLSIAGDLLAAVPTIIKAYKKPESESYRIFLFGATSAAITLLTIDTWTFAQAGFPVYILLICLLFFSLIRFPRLYHWGNKVRV